MRWDQHQSHSVMLSERESSEGRFSVVEASLYPHDGERAAKLLRVHHEQFVGNSIHRHLHKRFRQRQCRALCRALVRPPVLGTRSTAAAGWLGVLGIRSAFALHRIAGPSHLAGEWHPWMDGRAVGRDASAAANRPMDDPPLLSMTEGKVSE